VPAAHASHALLPSTATPAAADQTPGAAPTLGNVSGTSAVASEPGRLSVMSNTSGIKRVSLADVLRRPTSQAHIPLCSDAPPHTTVGHCCFVMVCGYDLNADCASMHAHHLIISTSNWCDLTHQCF
jgi:hypothetical protein